MTKYITFDDGIVSQAIIFHGGLQHKDVRDALRTCCGNFTLLGAGHVKDGKPHGSSNSLGIGPGTEDAFLIQQLLSTSVEKLELESNILSDDKARLDWLEAHNRGTFGIWPDGQDQSWTITGEPTDSYSGGIPMGDGPTLRAAIDDAMSREKQ